MVSFQMLCSAVEPPYFSWHWTEPLDNDLRHRSAQFAVVCSSYSHYLKLVYFDVIKGFVKVYVRGVQIDCFRNGMNFRVT